MSNMMKGHKDVPQVGLNKIFDRRALPYIYRVLKSKLPRTQRNELAAKEKHILDEINSNGYAIIPDFMDTDFCNMCAKDIDWILENKKEFVHEHSDLRVFGAEHLSEHIMKFASDLLLYKLANYHNGVTTLNAFTLANRIVFSAKSSKLGSGGGWHRDSNARQFKSILYLNDVNERNGAYQIIQYSHKISNYIKDSKDGRIKFGATRFSDEQIDHIISKHPERLKTITGKAGTLIVKDCSCIHRGSPLKEGKRYALTNYFFDKTLINDKLVEHFSPIVNPQYVIGIGK